MVDTQPSSRGSGHGDGASLSAGDLDQAEILSRISADRRPSVLRVVSEVGSTNDAIRQGGAADRTVLIADLQTSGRGRMGRCWHSPAGLGLYLSLLLRLSVDLRYVPRWTLGAAWAICRAMQRLGAPEVRIRWPNDLITGEGKLAGILAELRSSAAGAGELVLGVGVNVHHRATDFPLEPSLNATSLRRLLGPSKMVSRSAVAAVVIEELLTMDEMLRCGGWSAVAEGWVRLAPDAVGQRVRLGRDGAPGVTCGIGECGELLVERQDGTIEAVRTSDGIDRLEG